MKYLMLKLLAVTLALFSNCGALQAAVLLSGGLAHEYNLQPGDSATKVIELRNTGSQFAEIKVYREDLKITRSGKPRFVKTIGSHPRSNANWIKLNTDRVILAPGASQQISYTLQVPPNLNRQGSYWSTLMLEPVSSGSAESQVPVRDPNDSNIFVRQKARYGVRILTDIGTQGGAYLTFASPGISKNEAGERWLNVDILNQGDRFTRPHVWLDVFNRQGQNIGKFKAERHAIYVGEREDFQINISKLKPGNYKALLAAEDNRNGQVFGSDINLNIQP